MDKFITKSNFKKGIRCEKLFWLNINKYSFDDQMQSEIFDTDNAHSKIGTDIGMIAQNLFPGGIEIPFNISREKKIQMTQELLKNDQSVIFEATFEFDRVLVRVDVLVKNTDGSFDVYEIKSSKINSFDERKDDYLLDCGIQHLVLKENNIKVKNFFLTCLSDHTLEKDMSIKEICYDIDLLQKFFTHTNLTEKIVLSQDDIKKRLESFQKIKEDENEPSTEIGTYCKIKDQKCECYSYCWKKQRSIPDQSIFDLYKNQGFDKALDLFNKGTKEINQLCDEDIAKLTPTKRKYAELYINNEVKVDYERLKDFLSRITFPLCAFDFETINYAIPKYKGMKTYQRYPFQFSLDILSGPHSVPAHYEFLADYEEDGRSRLIDQLIENIPANALILTWNKSFEQGVLKELAFFSPNKKEELMRIHDSIIDLSDPFRPYSQKIKDSGIIQQPKLLGQYSIKKVLPVMDPSMHDAYKVEEGVNNGTEAMQGYLELLVEKNPEKRSKIKQKLLHYCGLDTEALFSILRKMQSFI